MSKLLDSTNMIYYYPQVHLISERNISGKELIGILVYNFKDAL